VDELETAFHELIDGYIDACKQLGQSPNKPYSGKLMLRIPTDLHVTVATSAEVSGESINKWVAMVLDKATHSH